MGPFSTYAPPGVYTQTTLDNSVASLAGNLRIPALIGTADEIQKVNGYELVRGSSATVDNHRVGEETTPVNGRVIQTQNYPLVVGDGLGRITNNTADVQVLVNGTQVIVAKVIGLTGQVNLALPTKLTDVVTISYYYKKTDTKVVDEDISDQADGANLLFYTHHKPIVDGSNAGHATTNVGNIIVKVNNSIVDVLHLDGVNGSFILVVAPASTDTVKITYYFNMYANTGDDLPVPGLTQIIRVGVSPETSDFIDTVDYAIIGNQIQWGTGFNLTPVVHTAGSEFFAEDKITGQLVDDKIYNEIMPGPYTGVEKVLTVKFTPIVDGTGRDIVTYDPSNVVVSVNSVNVDVTRVDGDAGKIYLKNPIPIGADVRVTYWRSRMVDEIYSIEAIISGGSGIGTYKITTLDGIRLGHAVPGTYTVASGLFTGLIYTSGPTVATGYTINETVTLTFTSNTHFGVSSSAVGGSSGAGVTGSTYIDSVTGLMFTLAPDALYAAADIVHINVVALATFTCGPLPITSIPGLYLIVNNTTDVTPGDITDLQTFNKSGKEPNVGDAYYISYYYAKTNYDCAIYTKFKDVTNDFGDLSASNSLVLAAYLAFLNGASALILCQVKKAVNSDLAPDQAYLDVLVRLQQDVNGVNPAVILPVTTSGSVISAVSQHCATQSSMRNRRERIGFFGFPVGTEPTEAANFASAINSERMIGVYPDGGVVELVNADGTVADSVVDGSFLAAAFAGLNVNAAYDVATPMTRKTLVGFTQLVRSMDEVTMDMVATRGITIIQKIASTFVIRHGMTTNMSSALTREIMIITIRDFIQQSTRNVLDQFIGQKMLSNLPGAIANAVSSMLKSAVAAQIIVDFKGVSAQVDNQQPDYITVSAAYIPIFGLNWISVQYTIRTKF
jgi:hypothetical protein